VAAHCTEFTFVELLYLLYLISDAIPLWR